MSHKLEVTNGRVNMAYVGEKPWHGLGVKIPPDLSPEQILKVAGLDWTVKKYPAYSILPIPDEKTNKTHTAVPVGWSSLVRESDMKVLDVVSNDWIPLQNSEAFDFFHEFVIAGDMEMHTAGSIRGGQIVWAMAKIKDSFELFGGDKIEGNLLFTNFLKYGNSTDVRVTPIRVICDNTVQLALSTFSDRMLKVSHRKKFDPEIVKETLGISREKIQKYKEMAEFLGSRRAKNEDIVSYFKRIFPHSSSKTNPESTKMSANAIRGMEILHTQPGANFAEGSWWQPFNAVTFMVDHNMGRSNDTRLASAWYGLNRELKIKALKTAVEMANS